MTMVGVFDHSAVAVNDLILAERFYAEVLGEILGGRIEGRTPQTTEELARRFKTLMEGRGASRGSELVYRGATPHSSVRLGKTVIPLSIYQIDIQEPPPEQLRGTPRLAYNVTSEQIDQAVEVFRRNRVAFEGPVEYPAPSLIARAIYFKDPSSNFLELCCGRS